jgi:hypothetical protein
MTQDIRARGDEERVAISLEARQADPTGPPQLVGYAALVNEETIVQGFAPYRERIAPGAFLTAIVENDVRALFNHDPNFVLARTRGGTLRLVEDARGLRYEADLNADDPQAMSIWAKVKRGDVSQSSFGFTVKRQEWEEVPAPGLPLRTILEVELFDVSPVTYPAYTRTSVTARDLPSAQRAKRQAAAAAEAYAVAAKCKERWV